MNSIYCSPSQVKTIMGESDGKNIKVDNFATSLIPQGAMINGIITDEDAMINLLSEMNTEYLLAKEDTNLVIDSNSILTKLIDVPPLSEGQILEFVEREFSQYGKEEGAEKIYDYSVINPHAESGGVTILAVGVSKGLIESYQSVFLNAGFNLKGINIGINAQIKLANFLPQLLTGTYILAQVDGKNLTFTLFNDGEYSLTNKYRLLNMTGTQEWFNEIGDNLSSMIQFNKGQRDTKDIETAYFTGIEKNETTALSESLQYLNIDIKELDFEGFVVVSGTVKGKGGFLPGNFLYNIGNLLKK